MGKNLSIQMNTLSVFVEMPYWFDGKYYSADQAFFKFIEAFGKNFQKVLIYGRLEPELKQQSYVLDPTLFEMRPLPYYPRAAALLGIRGIPVLLRAFRQMWQEMGEWSLAWIGGPTPISVLMALLCILRKKPFFLFLREDTLNTVGFHFTGAKRTLYRSIALVLVIIFRWIARKHLTFGVGSGVCQRFHSQGAAIRCTPVSLISTRDIIDEGEIAAKPRNPVPVLLNVSRLEREKGQDFLLLALRRLKDRGEIFRLNILGEGRFRTDLEQLTKELGLASQVEFLGHITFGPGLMNHYQSADFLILPSLTEGIPQVIFEAQANGLPIVATDVGGVPQVITHQVTGLLVPPANVEALADSISLLNKDRKLATLMVKNALREVKQFSQEVMVSQILNDIHDFYRINSKEAV